MKIIVLAAGSSPERDVSIVSGTGVCTALRSLGHEAILVDAFFGAPDADPATAFSGEYAVEAAAAAMRADTARAAEESRRKDRPFFGPQVLALCMAADIVFLTLHGANGEDGRVQAAFDLFRIPYTGTDYISSANAMDKTRTKQIFLSCDVPTPKGYTVRRGQEGADATSILKKMQLPLIVKPPCGGSSIGVTICHTEADVAAGEKLAFSLEENAVMEEFIDGDEFTCAVIDGKPYPVVSIVPKQGYYDFSNKYRAGATEEICPARIPDELTKEIQDLAVKAYRAIGLEAYAWMDFLVRKSDRKVYCIEANTLPGMTPTSLVPREAAAVGIDYAHLCQLMLDVSAAKYEG